MNRLQHPEKRDRFPAIVLNPDAYDYSIWEIEQTEIKGPVGCKVFESLAYLNVFSINPETLQPVADCLLPTCKKSLGANPFQGDPYTGIQMF